MQALIETETAFYPGASVRIKGSDATAVIDRLGTNPGVYRLNPPLGGKSWHIQDELEQA